MESEFRYVVVNVCHFSGVFNVVVRTAVGCEAYIVFNGVAEKEVVLRNVGGVCAYGLYRNLVYVDAIDKYRVFGNVICAENEVDESRLPDPVRPMIPTRSPALILKDTF